MTSLEFVEAASNNNLNKVRQMLETNGHLLNVKDREHDTAIMKAVRNCHATDVVSFLLEKGANINDQEYRDTINQTPIIIINKSINRCIFNRSLRNVDLHQSFILKKKLNFH